MKCLTAASRPAPLVRDGFVPSHRRLLACESKIAPYSNFFNVQALFEPLGGILRVRIRSVYSAYDALPA